MRQLKWGILGCGSIAHEMASALQKNGSTLYGVTCRTKETREQFVADYHVPHVYESYEKMLEEEAIDIIYIATPHNTHYEHIKQALYAGKHVLVEKAITVTADELHEVTALAGEKGLVLKEAMTLLYMPIYDELQKFVQDGGIGELKMVQVNFGSNKEYDVTNRFFSKELAGGALLDIGGYATAFVRRFLDEQPDVVMTTVKYFETGVDEQSGIILKNKKDQMAVIALTMRAKQPKRGIITGDKGFIEVYDYPRADKATFTETATGKVTEFHAGEMKDALLYEVKAMEKAVEGNAEGNTLKLSTEVMELLTEVRRQWEKEQ